MPSTNPVNFVAPQEHLPAQQSAITEWLHWTVEVIGQAAHYLLALVQELFQSLIACVYDKEAASIAVLPVPNSTKGVPSCLVTNLTTPFNNLKKGIEEHTKEEKDQPYATVEEVEEIVAPLKTEITNPNFTGTPITLEIQESEDANPARRPTMEDHHQIVHLPQGTLICLADGHGGSDVAKACVEKFVKKFPTEINNCQTGIRDLFRSLFKEINNEITKGLEEQEQEQDQGSTACFVFIHNKTGLVYTATLADSEARVYREINGAVKVIPLSVVRDWKSKKDFDRVDDFWKKHIDVTRKKPYYMRIKRVGGGINVSRAFGDRGYPAVSDKPKVTIFKLEPGDKIVIACDGLWDFVKDRDVIQKLENKKLAENLVKCAVDERSSTDNVSVITVSVKAYKN